MSENPQIQNKYLIGSLPKLFFATAAPIIFIMLVNGTFTLVDAYFLGEFVGADALTAVTLMFPAFMIIVALSSLVSGGFSSVVARLLGSGDLPAAKRSFVEAIFLSLIICAALIILFLGGGRSLIEWVTAGDLTLSQMGYDYISVLIFFAPITFVLAIMSDTLRSEGKMGAMLFFSLSAVGLNFVFNYLLIVVFEYGVAGSAYGTILAQACSLAAAFFHRKYANVAVKVKISDFKISTQYWREFIALGVPASLTYLGISLMSSAIIYNLQSFGVANYTATIAAYGIINRMMTFLFLPFLGLSMAFQSILGNNFGAKLHDRADGSVKIAIATAFIYCAGMQVLVNLIKYDIGGMFVGDVAIGLEVARLVPLTTLTFTLFGPLMIISTYFQATGDAKRSAILSLSRTYIFALPLTFILPDFIGENGIWLAGAAAEILVLVMTIFVLYTRYKNHGNRFGLLSTAG
ncbi:MAG: MATE family efflux transporter [Hyphomicrobiales bacterium]|nr:MAG: MATE family efflux transporter [Hyphomicrobiales bacterium]